MTGNNSEDRNSAEFRKVVDIFRQNEKTQDCIATYESTGVKKSTTSVGI